MSKNLKITETTHSIIGKVLDLSNDPMAGLGDLSVFVHTS